MIRFLLCVCAMMLTAFPAFAAAPAADASSFRGFIWGVSPEDVRAYETAYFYEEDNGDLVFFEDVKNGRILIRYHFDGGKLSAAQYKYQALHRPSAGEVLDILADEQAALTRTLGAPEEERIVWGTNRYRRTPHLLPRAYAMSHIRFETQWRTAESVVRLRSWRGQDYYQILVNYDDAARLRTQEQETFQPFTFNE